MAFAAPGRLAGAQPTGPAFPLAMKRHVMISFDIDSAVVLAESISKELGERTMPVFINVKRKPVADVIKHGIESSWVVVCLLSQAFQDSAECKQEVNYALQTGVPLIPVKVQGGGWKQSAWLADATSGLRWVDASPESGQDTHSVVQNITIVVKQVTGLEFSGGLTPRPHAAEAMRAPRKPVSGDQRVLIEALEHKATNTLHGWISIQDLASWAQDTQTPQEKIDQAVEAADKDLYGNLNIRTLLSVLSA
eukprot:c4798_g1_i1.p1 GENE.c4798_g1_i1~~c4798_g1_i1.p1  ORF type:complete len:262 (-),score=39.98 c4798_g1_i1:37-786(-)